MELNPMRRATIVAAVLMDLGVSKHVAPLTKEEKARGDKLDAWLDKQIADGLEEPDEHEYRDILLSIGEDAIKEQQ